MLKVIGTSSSDEARERVDLDELVRQGAQRMLVSALEDEVDEYVRRHTHERDERARSEVVRNGRGRARKVTLGAGTVEIAAPRVNDKRLDERGRRQRFRSQILPPYMRRSPKVAEVLPLLYLRGLSTGDFKEALPVLLGEDASGLSGATITRLTNVWSQ